MTTIRAAYDIFENISSEISKTKGTLLKSQNETFEKQKIFKKELESFLAHFIEIYPDFEKWPDSSVKDTAIRSSNTYDSDLKSLHRHLSLLHDNKTAIKDLSTIIENKTLEKNNFIKEIDKTSMSNVVDNLKLLNRKINGFEDYLPYPKALSWKALTGSSIEKWHWKIARGYDEKYGENRFSSDLNVFNGQMQNLNKISDDLSTLKSNSKDLENDQKVFETLNKELRLKPSKETFINEASTKALIKLSIESINNWIKSFPDSDKNIKIMTFKLAQIQGTERILKNIDASLKVVEKISAKINPALLKLRKGKSRAGSKKINLDAEGIKNQIFDVLKQMNPMNDSVAVALERLTTLKPNNEKSQSYFYQKTVSSNASNRHANISQNNYSTDWLLYWLVFCEFQNISNDNALIQTSDLAFGLNGVGQQLNDAGLNLDIFNNSPATDLAPGLEIDVGNGTDWNIPSIDTNISIPDISVSDISMPSFNIDIPSVNIDIPIDIPSIDIPNIDVSIPDFSSSFDSGSSSSFDSGGGGW